MSEFNIRPYRSKQISGNYSPKQRSVWGSNVIDQKNFMNKFDIQLEIGSKKSKLSRKSSKKSRKSRERAPINL